MSVEKIDTLVVGAGQAGIALCEHLGKQGVPFLVLEKSRIAEAWRTSRWDALVTNGPVWHDRFPNLKFKGNASDEFVGKDRVVDYIEEYADMVNAPVRTGVEVLSAARFPDRAGFCVETTSGVIEATRIVSATGAFQEPVIPPIVPQDNAVHQMHSALYRNPDQLADGAVMVVGAGSSGAQISDELNRAGRKVFLSVGPHDRPPRRYRERDFVWWLGVLGLWDLAAQKPGTEHVTISVSGAYGGRTMDFRRLASEGVTLLGRTESFGGHPPWTRRWHPIPWRPSLCQSGAREPEPWRPPCLRRLPSIRGRGGGRRRPASATAAHCWQIFASRRACFLGRIQLRLGPSNGLGSQGGCVQGG